VPAAASARSAFAALALSAAAILPGAAAVTNAPALTDDSLTEAKVLERVKASLDRALEYLTAKQKPDGSFGERHCATSLALLAFMGRGHVPGRGPYKDVLERGKKYLLSTQLKGGYMGHVMYEHALATLALAEMYGMDPDPELEAKLRNAVDLIVRVQSPSGGWRYQPHPGDQDLSVTIMQIVALRAANNAEIPVPAETINKAIGYVRSCAVASGGYSYSSGGGVSVQMAAAGALALQLLGQYNEESIFKSADYMNTLSIRWGSGGPSYFYYFHYYAMQAHYQAGGKYWNAWHPKVREILLANQNADGSWITPPGCSVEAADPYPTAMACLVLEVYLHFLPAYQR
jgi:hypothetical protein